MRFGYCLTILAIITTLAASQEEGEGERRLRKLRELEAASKGIISFTTEDFKYLHTYS